MGVCFGQSACSDVPLLEQLILDSLSQKCGSSAVSCSLVGTICHVTAFRTSLNVTGNQIRAFVLDELVSIDGSILFVQSHANVVRFTNLVDLRGDIVFKQNDVLAEIHLPNVTSSTIRDVAFTANNNLERVTLGTSGNGELSITSLIVSDSPVFIIFKSNVVKTFANLTRSVTFVTLEQLRVVGRLLFSSVSQLALDVGAARVAGHLV
jgi:hypothetical protein